MTSVVIFFKIAAYEAKILLRSWGFRIFTLLGLFILGLLTVGIAAPSFSFPYYFRSLSGSIPLFSFKLFNVFQGIIVVFMATEFFKRDRRTDSTQVIFSRSFSNSNYILGKFFGILGLFILMNIFVGLITVLVHLFLSVTPFSLKAYLLYFLTLNLPTLVFLVGLSFLLGMTIRSQAAVVLLENRGRLAMIYPAARLVDILATMRGFHLEPKRIRVIYPGLKSEAKLALIEASLGARPGLKVMPPLLDR